MKRSLRDGYADELGFSQHCSAFIAIENRKGFLNKNLRMFIYWSYNFSSIALYFFPWKNEKVS